MCSIKHQSRSGTMHTLLKSNTKEVTIGADKPFVIIGERLNPTGIKKLGQALVEQNFDYVKYLAQRYWISMSVIHKSMKPRSCQKSWKRSCPLWMFRFVLIRMSQRFWKQA